jgi:predicted HTH transcriptional regulator
MVKNCDDSHFPAENQLTQMPQYNPNLPPLSGLILSMFNTYNPRQTLRNIATRSRASRSTIRKHIRQLIHAGLLRKHGKGKGTWYTM